ncbi:MAG: apolipoprotein N-acyltransferase [Terrimicrobiaceae bacterium]
MEHVSSPGLFAVNFQKAWPWAAATLSGLLLAMCFAPVGWGSLAWIALTPLVAAVWFSEEPSRFRGLRLFFLGYVCGLVYFVGSLHWLWTVTIPGWLLLGSFLAIYPGVWAVFLGLVAKPRPREGDELPVWFRSRSNFLAAALAASAWVVLEWVRGTLFSGFGWNGLGVALVDNLPMIQFADITGVGGVSFLLVMVNVVAVVTVVRLRMEILRKKMRAHYDFSLTVVLVAAAFSYGARTLLTPPPASEKLTFGAVQANVPISQKRDPAQEDQILALHARLSEFVFVQKPDLLIWPEAATPQPLFLNQKTWEAVRGVAERHDGDFLLGTVHYEERGDFNSAVLLTQRGTDAQIYHKMHLVPFGEYVPLRKSFPVFAWIVGDIVPEDFDFGPTASVLELSSKPFKIGPLICFEDTLAYLARQFVHGGAQVFVTVTNNAWFLRSAGSEQHRANAVFRTIENRIPMIRAANTGVTCAIDRFGRETHRLQEADGNTFFEGFLVGSVQIASTPSLTFYTRHGDVFTLLCFAVAALATAGAIAKKLPRKP